MPWSAWSSDPAAPFTAVWIGRLADGVDSSAEQWLLGVVRKMGWLGARLVEPVGVGGPAQECLIPTSAGRQQGCVCNSAFGFSCRTSPSHLVYRCYRAQGLGLGLGGSGDSGPPDGYSDGSDGGGMAMSTSRLVTRTAADGYGIRESSVDSALRPPMGQWSMEVGGRGVARAEKVERGKNLGASHVGHPLGICCSFTQLRCPCSLHPYSTVPPLKPCLKLQLMVLWPCRCWSETQVPHRLPTSAAARPRAWRLPAQWRVPAPGSWPAHHAVWAPRRSVWAATSSTQLAPAPSTLPATWR